MVFTEATTRVGSIQVNISRMILALVLLLLSVLVMGLDLRMSSSQLLNLTYSGIVGLVLGDSFLFRAFKDIGARVSMLVMSLVPGFTALMALAFLDESLSLQVIIGMVVTISGVAIVVLERRPAAAERYNVTPKGLLFALLGAMGQASGLIFAKLAFVEAPIHGLVATTVRIGTAVIIFLPAALLLRWYRNPFTVYKNNPTAFGYTAAGAVLGPFLGITFSFIAIAYTEVAVATTIMALPPIIMLPLVRYFYHEKLSLRAIGGAVVAVAGVAVLFLR